MDISSVAATSVLSGQMSATLAMLKNQSQMEASVLALLSSPAGGNAGLDISV